MVVITARRQSRLVHEEMVEGRAADDVFETILKGHPDCEVVVKLVTGAILLSVGPRRHVCPVMLGPAITGAA